MKQFIIKLLIVFLGVMYSIPGFATDYGTDKTSCDIRYFVTSGTVKTHSSYSAKSKVMRTIKAGDYVYVDSDEYFYNGDEAWVKISGHDEYVLSYYLTIEDNPQYVSTSTEDILESKQTLFKLGFHNIPKWLGITMLSVWVLMALILCCVVLTKMDYRLRWFPPNKKPGYVSSPDPEYGFGQSKVLFFSPAPYKLFSSVAIAFIATFITTIVLFLLVGGLTWLCTWAGRILLVGLFWIIMIALYILGVGLVLNGIFGVLKIVSLALCWIPFTLAVNMGDYTEDVYDWGYNMVEWGTRVFTTFNIFEVALYIIKTYWLTALVISAAPLLLFLAAAVLFMIFAFGLMIYENIKMKRYNVSHPCPFCGEHSEPAVYLSDGIPLHVPLRPSVWGMFNITHPATGEKMPTLFLKGKDNLDRRCVHCDNLISAKIGAEKHIAVAGVPNSGKSTLLYRIVSELSRMKVGNENICTFTDNMGVDETSVKSFLNTIDKGQKMEFFPDKTSEGRHKSIQMLVQNPSGSLPYRLYINDIAGEMFTTSNNQYEDAPFFKNTNVLIFALDPFTMKANELDFSPEFASWYKKNVGDKNDSVGKVDLDEAFSALVNTISRYRNEKERSKMKLMLTYVKTDTGYLNELSNKNDSALLREFAISEMGLESLISKLESVGFEISYYAISASDDAKKSGISDYISDIFDGLNISFKNLSEKQIAERKSKQNTVENVQREDVLKNPRLLGLSTSKQVGVIILSFVIGGMIIFGLTKINANIHNRNYEEMLQLVQKASSEPLSYDEVMSVIKTGVSERTLSDSQKEELTNMYMSADREKRKHISQLRSVLYANFESQNGRMSNFEISLKYNALDLKKFQQYFDEFQKLAPNDAQYLKYRKLFDQLLLKYKVSL